MEDISRRDLKGIYNGIADIQSILGLEDARFGHSDWKQRHDYYTSFIDDEDWEDDFRLDEEIKDDESTVDALESQCELQLM